MVQLDENVALAFERIFFRVLFYLVAAFVSYLIYKKGKELDSSSTIGGNSWTFLAGGFSIIAFRTILGLLINSLDPLSDESLIDILSLLRYTIGTFAAILIFYGFYILYRELKSVYGG